MLILSRNCSRVHQDRQQVAVQSYGCQHSEGNQVENTLIRDADPWNYLQYAIFVDMLIRYGDMPVLVIPCQQTVNHTTVVRNSSKRSRRSRTVVTHVTL